MNFETLASSPLKDKYFFRNKKWDWVDEKTIHIFDNESTEIETIDSWAKYIFISAEGFETVAELIKKAALWYPKNQIPKDLDVILLENINDLYLKNKIIDISDEFFPIEDSFRYPQSDEGTLNVLGVWEGVYEYSPYYYSKDVIDKKIRFTINITHTNGNYFTGKVEDNQEDGGTPGIGFIKGEYDQDKDMIKLYKYMPIECIIGEDGERIIDKNKKHKPLIYEGNLSWNKKIIFGEWRFKKEIRWFGIIPKFVSFGEGTFRMEKING
jgi:hypothetical protein